MWNSSTVWEAWWQMMQDVNVKLSPTLSPQKKHSTRLFSPKQYGIKLKDETSEVLRLEHSSLWCCHLDTSESRSVIRPKFWTVVMEKVGDQLAQSAEKRRSVTNSEGWEEYPCLWTAFWNTLLKEGHKKGNKWREGEEEDVSSCWTT